MASAAQPATARPGGATAEVTVKPRMVVFIQGMNSSSHCPDGRSFTTRAPQWLSPYLFEPANTGGLALTPDSYAYFSYSGRWCTADGAYRPGATADYRASDTCGGIDEEHAGRLRAFIDSFAPARVAVVGHSMGGLVAAFTWLTRAESLLTRAESGRRRTPVESTFVENFFPDLARSQGQDWCEESLDIYVRFLKENMLGSLQKALDVINRFQPDGRSASA